MTFILELFSKQSLPRIISQEFAEASAAMDFGLERIDLVASGSGIVLYERNPLHMPDGSEIEGPMVPAYVIFDSKTGWLKY